MKKRILAAGLALCAALLVGCSGDTVSSVSLGSSWSKDKAATYTYQITQEASHLTNNSGYTFTLISGTYTTKITPRRVGDVSYIDYETKTEISGVYTVTSTGEKVEVNDVTTTKTTLHEINTYSLFPLSSEKTLCQTGVAQTENAYVLNRYDIKYSVAYDYEGKTATATLHAKNEQTGEYDKPVQNVAPTRTYKKLKAGSFFDNDSLLFAVRAFPIKKGAGTPLTTLDVINARKTSLYFMVQNVDPYEREMTVNGSLQKFTVLPADISISTTMSGTAYDILFALEAGNNKNVPIVISSEMPYGLGKLVYSLTAFSD